MPGSLDPSGGPGAALDAEKARRAMEDSFADPLAFTYPIVLLAGEIAPSFDELEVLRATVQVARLPKDARVEIDLVAIVS